MYLTNWFCQNCPSEMYINKKREEKVQQSLIYSELNDTRCSFKEITHFPEYVKYFYHFYNLNYSHLHIY